MTNKMKVLLGLVALAALSACGTPKFLVGDQFIGGRNIKYILRPVGGNDAVAVAVRHVPGVPRRLLGHGDARCGAYQQGGRAQDGPDHVSAPYGYGGRRPASGLASKGVAADRSPA